MTTLGVKRRTLGMKDSRGNRAVTFGDPQPWPVWGLAPGGNEDPMRPNRDLSRVVWTVYAPADAKAPGEHDRVVVDDVEFDVHGRPGDWTRGPWPHPTAGVVVELEAVTG